jgi:hypothetical protein
VLVNDQWYAGTDAEKAVNGRHIEYVAQFDEVHGRIDVKLDVSQVGNAVWYPFLPEKGRSA